MHGKLNVIFPITAGTLTPSSTRNSIIIKSSKDLKEDQSHIHHHPPPPPPPPPSQRQSITKEFEDDKVAISRKQKLIAAPLLQVGNQSPVAIKTNAASAEVTTLVIHEQRFCEICQEEILEKTQEVILECEHSFHNLCLRNDLASQINSDSFPVMCPIEGCEQEPSMYLLSTLVSREHFQLSLDFEQSLCQEIQQNNCFNCDQRFLSDLEVFIHQCLRCKSVNCLKCHSKYHGKDPCKPKVQKTCKSSKKLQVVKKIHPGIVSVTEVREENNLGEICPKKNPSQYLQFQQINTSQKPPSLFLSQTVNLDNMKLSKEPTSTHKARPNYSSKQKNSISLSIPAKSVPTSPRQDLFIGKEVINTMNQSAKSSALAFLNGNQSNYPNRSHSFSIQMVSKSPYFNPSIKRRSFSKVPSEVDTLKNALAGQTITNSISSSSSTKNSKVKSTQNSPERTEAIVSGSSLMKSMNTSLTISPNLYEPEASQCKRRSLGRVFVTLKPSSKQPASPQSQSFSSNSSTRF